MNIRSDTVDEYRSQVCDIIRSLLGETGDVPSNYAASIKELLKSISDEPDFDIDFRNEASASLFASRNLQEGEIRGPYPLQFSIFD